MSSLQTTAIDQTRLAEWIAEKRAQQNIGAAAIGALAASLVGAGLWAVVTVTTGFQIGFMAVGVGFLVGYAVRQFGKGIDKPFGYLGAGFSLLGCLLGNLLSAVGFVSQHQSIGFFAILSKLNLDAAVHIMTLTFSPIDLLFYFIGIQRGYSFAFVRPSQEEMAKFSVNVPATTAPEPAPASVTPAVELPSPEP